MSASDSIKAAKMNLLSLDQETCRPMVVAACLKSVICVDVPSAVEKIQRLVVPRSLSGIANHSPLREREN